jgi:hypothetical protein
MDCWIGQGWFEDVRNRGRKKTLAFYGFGPKLMESWGRSKVCIDWALSRSEASAWKPVKPIIMER